MIAKARRGAKPPANGSPAVQDRERQAVLYRDFRFDLAHWIGTDPRLALRVMRLIEEIIREPFAGIGKPEPLKHRHHGEWSRRITDHHRMEYIVTDPSIYFARARHHYDHR